MRASLVKQYNLTSKFGHIEHIHLYDLLILVILDSVPGVQHDSAALLVTGRGSDVVINICIGSTNLKIPHYHALRF